MKNLILISILFFSINLFSQTSEEWNVKGDAKVEQNDYKGAISDYTKSIEIDSNNSLVYANRGRAKATMQDYRGAIADYTKALELSIDLLLSFTPSLICSKILVCFNTTSFCS